MCRQSIYPLYHFSYSYIFNRLIRRNFEDFWSQKACTNITSHTSWKQKLPWVESVLQISYRGEHLNWCVVGLTIQDPHIILFMEPGDSISQKQSSFNGENYQPPQTPPMLTNLICQVYILPPFSLPRYMNHTTQRKVEDK